MSPRLRICIGRANAYYKGTRVVVGAIKAENPNLVIMYYGLSPLLIENYDLHSPNDLVYCGGIIISKPISASSSTICAESWVCWRMADSCFADRRWHFRIKAFVHRPVWQWQMCDQAFIRVPNRETRWTLFQWADIWTADHITKQPHRIGPSTNPRAQNSHRAWDHFCLIKNQHVR